MSKNDEQSGFSKQYEDNGKFRLRTRDWMAL